MTFMFDGVTYDPHRDGYRLRNNTQRVLIYMLDGEWHGKTDLEPVGGSAYDSRIRDLRKAKFGGFHIEEERDPTTDGTMSRYRLDVSSVTEEKIRAILEWTVQPTTKQERGVQKARIDIRRAVKMMNLEQCQGVLALIGTFTLVEPSPEADPDVEVWELWGDDAD